MFFFDYDEPLFRPPSEADSLIFQITVGCSHNKCRFCNMYKMKNFRLRPLTDIFREIDSIPDVYRSSVQRIFLGDGDGLVYPQQDLLDILDKLTATFSRLTRVSAYASPGSLTTKNVEQLEQLKVRKLRILYFGLESGDAETLRRIDKGFDPEQMLGLCRKVQRAGIKLSVTAVFGLAGRLRSHEHAVETARWINTLSPEFFSLLTLFRRGNDEYFSRIEPLTNGEILEEALLIAHQLNPKKTVLRSNHGSNILHLKGSYPKDRSEIICQAERALEVGRAHPEWFERFFDE